MESQGDDRISDAMPQTPSAAAMSTSGLATDNKRLTPSCSQYAGAEPLYKKNGMSKTR